MEHDMSGKPLQPAGGDALALSSSASSMSERASAVKPYSTGFFETVSQIFLSPLTCFQSVAVGETVPVRGFSSAMALFAVVTAGMIGSDIIWKDRSVFDLATALPLGLLSAFFAAVYLSSILSAASHCFTGQTRFRQTLTVVFLSAAPWLLYIPVAFLKSSMGFIGNVLGMLLGMGLWAWSVALFALGMKAIYRLSIERTIIFLTLPLSMMLVFTLWLSDLFHRFGQILP